MKDFPQHLKAWRIHRRLTQRELAELSATPRANLVALERGRRDCTLRTLARLAQALKISPGQLLDQWPGPVKLETLDRHQVQSIAQALLDPRKTLPTELQALRDAVAWQALPLLRATGRPIGRLRLSRRRQSLPKPVERQILEKLSRLLASTERFSHS